jgi:hypothetical protein
MWAFLSAAVGPLAIRALVAIGFSAVSFAGVSSGFAALVSYSQTQWSAMPTAVLQLATLAGVPAGIGLVIGAMTARIALWMAANATKLIFKT